MFIEGVTVCVNCDDMLAWSLPLNKQVFDKLVVVTSEDDWHTQNLCRHYNVECVKTNIFKDGAFPKGTAINLGLDRLSRKDWLIHFDCDIVMPPRTREMLQIAQIQKDTIYSAPRMNCPNFESWIKAFIKPPLIHEKEIYVHLGAFPMGALVSKTYTRDVDFEFEKGFMPIGYFQVWNDNGVKKIYPEEHQDCSRGDMTFSLKNWPKRLNRQLIPELVLIHLMTEDGKQQGINWSGRKTSRFGPVER